MISWISWLTVAVNKKNILIIVVLIIIIALGGVYFFKLGRSIKTISSQKTFSQKSIIQLAKCLTSKKVTMYGAYWCPHCQKQKKEFGDAFKYVTYVECTKNVKLCTAKKIDGYPTWIFANGQRIKGEASFEDLAAKSSCKAS